MVINRRDILRHSVALSAMTVFGAPAVLAANQQVPVEDGLLASACRKKDGTFAVVVLTESGHIVREVPLSGRGHDATYHPKTGRIVAFARRPGNFAVAFNAHDLSEPTLFTTPTSRHFFGHGIFSRDGRLLYTTENDFGANHGVIGIYDASNTYGRIGEFPSHGIGPHDITILDDDRTLVVANGGIETHPDFGRAKLNLNTMSPSLCFIDRTTGDLTARQKLPSNHHHLSIRHLAATSNSDVWFGCQWEGALIDTPALIGSASLDKEVSLLESTTTVGPMLRGYIASVSISASARWLAASAPRANRVLIIDTERQIIHNAVDVADGSGVARGRDEHMFNITSGHGALVSHNPTTPLGNPRLGEKPDFQTAPANPVRNFSDISFDNHLLRLSPPI